MKGYKDDEAYNKLLNNGGYCLFSVIHDFYDGNRDKYDNEFIQSTIYYLCQKSASAAGSLLLWIMKNYGNLYAELSVFFIIYGANVNNVQENELKYFLGDKLVNNDEKNLEKTNLLHVAINKKLPLFFLEKLFDQEISYPDNDYISDMRDAFNDPKQKRSFLWTPISRAILESNQMALDFLVEKYPNKVNEVMSCLKEFLTKKDGFSCVSSNYSSAFNFTHQELHEAMQMFVQSIKKSYANQNKVTDKNHSNLLIVLNYQLENITTLEQCYALYAQYSSLNYQDQVLKIPVIELIQEKICQIFVKNDFIDKCDSIEDYHKCCETAFAHPIFYKVDGVKENYLNVIKAHLNEAEDILKIFPEKNKYIGIPKRC